MGPALATQTTAPQPTRREPPRPVLKLVPVGPEKLRENAAGSERKVNAFGAGAHKPFSEGLRDEVRTGMRMYTGRQSKPATGTAVDEAVFDKAKNPQKYMGDGHSVSGGVNDPEVMRVRLQLMKVDLTAWLAPTNNEPNSPPWF